MAVDKTFVTKQDDIKREWFVVDAQDQSLAYLDLAEGGIRDAGLVEHRETGDGAAVLGDRLLGLHDVDGVAAEWHGDVGLAGNHGVRPGLRVQDDLPRDRLEGKAGNVPGLVVLVEGVGAAFRGGAGVQCVRAGTIGSCGQGIRGGDALLADNDAGGVSEILLTTGLRSRPGDHDRLGVGGRDVSDLGAATLGELLVGHQIRFSAPIQVCLDQRGIQRRAVGESDAVLQRQRQFNVTPITPAIAVEAAIGIMGPGRRRCLAGDCGAWYGRGLLRRRWSGCLHA